MKIDEAIEILTSSLDNLDPWSEGDIGAAATLSIEALKRHQEAKKNSRYYPLLPGETS